MIKKIILAIIIILILVLVGSFVVSNLFVEYGPKLTQVETKTLVSPGTLINFDPLDQGLFTTYNNTGQSILSKYSEDGIKIWERVFSSSKLLVDSSYKNLIVADLSSREINILDIDGNIENSFKPVGQPLYCTISNDKRNFVVSETDSSQTSWQISLELKDNNGKELFTKTFTNMEVISADWSPLGIAVLVFDFSEESSGQYLYIFDNYGKELYQKRFENEVYDYDLSPSGDYLIYASKEEVGIYNLLLDTSNTLEYDNILGVGFSSENRALLMQNYFSFLPPENKTKLIQINTSGQEEGELKYKGSFLGYFLANDGTIAVATETGIYLSNNLVAYNHIETTNIRRVVFDKDFNIYVLKFNDTINWYK